jgi:HEAT repeat protein
VLAARISAGGASGRVEAIEALGQLGGPDAGPVLARELWSERPEVRAAAARAVGRLRHEPAAPWLEALRSDYCGEVRRAAVEALAKLPSERRR